MWMVMQITILVILCSGMVLRGMRRFTYAVRWQPREQAGLKYELGTQSYRGHALGFLLRFRAPDGVRFLVRRETGFDRLAKALRIAVEPQLHDGKFDARFYVECTDDELLAAARGRPDLLKLMTALQARVTSGFAKLIELRCENGRLDLMIERNMTTGVERAESDALEWLRPIAEAIRSVPPRTKTVLDRGFAARVVFVAIFMAGLLGSLALYEFFSDRMADDMGMFRYSVPYSLGALALALLLAALWLRRVPGCHRVLAACLLIGVPGFLCCGALVVRELDLELPQPPPDRIALKYARVFTSSTRRGDSHYRVSFGGDDHRLWGVSPLQLGSDDYLRVSAVLGSQRRPATLVWHPGALGLPWVELDPIPGGNSAATAPH